MAHRLSIKRLLDVPFIAMLVLAVESSAAMAGELALSRSQLYSVLDLPQRSQALTGTNQTVQYTAANRAAGVIPAPAGGQNATQASVRQNGESNAVSADQTTGDTLNVMQAGNQNVVTAVQGGWTGAVVRQTGNENSAQLQLFHAGSHVELLQTGKQKISVNQY